VRFDSARALAFVILAAAAFPGAAGAVGHERIPLESWSYRAIERFEALGACTLAEDRPFTRDEFIRIVETIVAWAPDQTLSPRDAYDLGRLQREYTAPAARADPRQRYDRALYAADSSLAIEADFDIRGFAERPLFGDEVEYFVGSAPTAKVHIGGRVTYDLRYQLLFGPEHDERADDHKPSRRTKSFNGLTSLFDRSYVLATWPHVDLIAGRDYVDWGPARAGGGLLTPGLRFSIDQLGGRLRYGAFRLDAFQGQLFGDPERWMAGHRLEATFGRTVVGLSEAVVYNSRGIDMLYLLPLAWFYANQFNERDNDDNVVWSVDAKSHPIDGLTINGSLLIDDFQFEREEGYPDKIGFDVGFLWVPDRPLGLTLRGSYRRVDIYTYSHVDSLSMYVTGAGDLSAGDVLLGGIPAPDAESWRVDVEVFPRPIFSVVAGVFGARIGEGRDVRGFEPGDDKDPPFPSGVVDETIGFDFGGRYGLGGDSSVSFLYAHASAKNRGNVAGDDPVTDAFRVEIRWDIP
jgi:hypothetical protein